MNAWHFDDDDTASSSDSITLRSENPRSLSSRCETSSSFRVTSKKHEGFLDDPSASSESALVATSSRRKQVSSQRELVLEDNDDSDNDNVDATNGGPSRTNTQPTRSNVTVTTDPATPTITHTVMRSKHPPQQSTIAVIATPSSSTAASITPDKKSNHSTMNSDGGATTAVSCALRPETTEALLHYLVREFLALHINDNEVLRLFGSEQPTANALSDKDAKKLFERVTGRKHASSSSTTPTPSLLEQFLVRWDEATHARKCERASVKRTSSSKSRSSESKAKRTTTAAVDAAAATADSGDAGDLAKKKSSSSSPSTSKKKPTLNVITAAETLDSDDTLPTDGDQQDDNNGDGVGGGGGHYNRLNHPGLTPKAQSHVTTTASILGDPGSTPKARSSDLRTLGFDEDELRTPVPTENLGSSTSSSSSAATLADNDKDDADCDLSEYAMRKRTAKKHTKHVWIGESGTTPTKEYIFFRETPPSFVTESVEAAIEVLETLGIDPAYKLQAAASQERFVELSSSDVAKYRVGQVVERLGAQRNVSGVVSKVYGSRQCGSSGPGTVVIDTCPDATDGVDTANNDGSNDAAGTASTQATYEADAFELDDDDAILMDELLS